MASIITADPTLDERNMIANAMALATAAFIQSLAVYLRANPQSEAPPLDEWLSLAMHEDRVLQ